MQWTAEEIAEIERHKYFLSEKRGQDVGWEYAEADWERHHASSWRTDRVPTESERQPCCQPAHPDRAGKDVPTHTEIGGPRIDRVSCEPPQPATARYGGRWQQFLSRFFARSE